MITPEFAANFPGMQPRALLFDLDGTLIDSLPDLTHALNRLFSEIGLRHLAEAEVRMMIGDGARKLVERALAAAGQAVVADFDNKLARFLELYEEEPAVRTRPYPGVMETLALLKTMGFKLAVVTNKPQDATLKALAGLGLDGFFDSVVGGGVTEKLKPHPMALAHALREMRAEAGKALMVGDNANDVEAAKALGIPVIVVAYGYSRIDPKQLGADLLIDHFADLPAALRGFP